MGPRAGLDDAEKILDPTGQSLYRLRCPERNKELNFNLTQIKDNTGPIITGIKLCQHFWCSQPIPKFLEFHERRKVSGMGGFFIGILCRAYYTNKMILCLMINLSFITFMLRFVTLTN